MSEKYSKIHHQTPRSAEELHLAVRVIYRGIPTLPDSEASINSEIRSIDHTTLCAQKKNCLRNLVRL